MKSIFVLDLTIGSSILRSLLLRSTILWLLLLEFNFLFIGLLEVFFDENNFFAPIAAPAAPIIATGIFFVFEFNNFLEDFFAFEFNNFLEDCTHVTLIIFYYSIEINFFQ